MTIKSGQIPCSGLPDSLNCAVSQEWLGPEQDGTEKRCTVTLSQSGSRSQRRRLALARILGRPGSKDSFQRDVQG